MTALREYWHANKTLPSFAGVGELLGMSSTASVWTAVKRLVDGGFLVRLEGHVLAPGPHFFESDVSKESTSEAGPRHSFLTQPELIRLIGGKGNERVGYQVDTDEFSSRGITRGAVAVIDPFIAAKPNDVIAVMAVASNDFRLRVYPRNRRIRSGWIVIGVVVLALNIIRST
ncbi:hypothetical protein PQR70_36710 [Paraburkholderia madseniana]|uniref:hypothetical protein n=1 Tax=Paraburkholderia madseniana TaxID=2599607 RepID=UPI0038BA1DA6